MASNEEVDFRPFDLLDDNLVLTILRCLPDPESLGRVARVSKRLAGLCKESYAWKPLLDSALSSSGNSFLVLPSEGAGWRERYKQWHMLSSLSWSHCTPAAGSASPSARYAHRAVAVSADRAYVFGGIGEQEEEVLGDLWMLRCDSAATGTASWELVAPMSEQTPTARHSATLSPVSLSDSARPARLVLFGGYDGGICLNEVWLFDTRTAAWTMLLPHAAQQAADASVHPDGRVGHSAITHNRSSEVVIFGGSADDRLLNDVLSFSVRTHQWTLHECAGASPSPRMDHAACRVAESHSLIPLVNRLVVFGGNNPAQRQVFDLALRCFDLHRRRWIDLAVGGGDEITRSRTHHAAIPCGGGVLIFGGCGSDYEHLNETVLLRLCKLSLNEPSSEPSPMFAGPRLSHCPAHEVRAPVESALWGVSAAFRPFNLLDDGLLLAILRCLADPDSIGCTALVSKRLAVLTKESYAWKPLLELALSSSGKGLLELLSEGAGWRERYKQWHTLSSLSWSHCPPAAGSAQPMARFCHCAAAVSADRAYVFGGYDGHGDLLGDLWMLHCESTAAGSASWELVAPTSEHTPIARALATLSPVSLSDSAHPQAADASVRPDGRFGHSVITHNSSSEVVIFGGLAEDGSCLNDVLSFSIGTRQWTLHEYAGASPSPRADHSACRDSLNDMWEYALDTRAWTQLVSAGGSAPSPREGHSLIPLGNRLVVFGGCNYAINSYDPALHCFDLQRRRWSGLTADGEHLRARTGHAVIPCGDGVLIFGGLGSSKTLFNDSFLLRVWL
ncbi:hypothetical protein T492DRAFT_916000 [Pavlovales sp. CCMP2436]|nr:hypothetical protein T492DRAFT_916000 [Pavlovales sp. CCMP2436]